MMQPVSSSARTVKPASFLRRVWVSVFSSNPRETLTFDFPSSQELTLDKGSYSPDLADLVDALKIVQSRVLANAFLLRWFGLLRWILLGLIIAAMFSAHMSLMLFLAGGLVALSAGGAAAWVWWSKPSAYRLAYELDSVTGLCDRLSTAIHFGAVEHPDPLLLRQRRDAAGRLKGVDPKTLFPLRMPAFATSVLALLVILSGLFAYRSHFHSPMLSLMHGVSGASLQKSVMSPLAAVKNELLALVERDAETPQTAIDKDAVPGLADAKDADKQLAGENGIDPDDDSEQEADSNSPTTQGEEGDLQQGGPTSQGQDAGQAAGGPQQQMGSTNQKQPQGAGQNGEQGGSDQQPQGQSPAGNSVMQALKNLMKNMAGDQAGSQGQAGGQPSSSGSSQQAGNSAGQGAKSDDAKDTTDQKSSGSTSDSQKPGSGAGNGSTPLPSQSKPAPAIAGNLVPDRVDIQANNYRQQGQIRTLAIPGDAQVPLRDVKPQPTAAVKGAEQENIPERYRLYVQRYFERSDTKTTDPADTSAPAPK
jgi:hypothetical protein